MKKYKNLKIEVVLVFNRDLLTESYEVTVKEPDEWQTFNP